MRRQWQINIQRVGPFVRRFPSQRYEGSVTRAQFVRGDVCRLLVQAGAVPLEELVHIDRREVADLRH